MAESKIEWTDYTFNPWRGCTKVSPACEHCYAATMSKRNPEVLGVWGKHGTRAIAAESYWKLPLKWNRMAEIAGKRKRVFCASLADVFESENSMPPNAWPSVQAARERLFELIVKTPHLDWLLLTKRPENIQSMSPSEWYDNAFPRNVWMGTTVENQKYANERIPQLRQIPAKVRFLSVEPMLGAIDLRREWISHKKSNGGINWVIIGGESGPKSRPFFLRDALCLVNLCLESNIPVFLKQFGALPVDERNEFIRLADRKGGDISEWPEDLQIRQVPEYINSSTF